MARDKAIPERVQVKNGRYYLVVADGKKRRWNPLTKVKEGLPALYAAMAQKMAEDVQDDRMPALIALWQRDVGGRLKPKTQENNNSRLRVIGEAFAEFRAGQVRAPDVSEFLQPFRTMARTHNQYRALMRELMRFAIEKGMRDDNPVAGVIRTVPEKPRTRYLTDSEVRRIKVTGFRGEDGKRTRTGHMLAALIDMAYLTGQDIGMLLNLRWQRDADDPNIPHVCDAGLFFRRSKVSDTTGAAVLIEWTPRLREVLARLEALRDERLAKKRASQRIITNYLFTGHGGLPWGYKGANKAWTSAVRRAGVPGAMFRDLRAKALTDKENRDGMRGARDMGQHSTEAQTADYVRLRSGRSTRATR